MFGRSRTKPVCPVDSATKAWIDRRLAWLCEEFGGERLQSARVVLPTAEFFPDRYSGTEEGARAMLDRVCGYMDLAPESVELSLYQDRNPNFEDGWRQGTLGLYEPDEGIFRVWVEVSNLADPTSLVATIAHELAHVHLLGHGRVSAETEDHEPLSDLLTVFLGLGVLRANATIYEDHWHDGSVSGWNVGRRGYLTMPMYGYALAWFAHARRERRPPWAKVLRPDVGAPFRQSLEYLEEHGRPEVEFTAEDSPADAEGETHEATEADPRSCVFCGKPLDVARADREADGGGEAENPTVCAECRASIDDNAADIAVEQEAMENLARLGRRIGGWGCLAVLGFLAAMAVLSWLL